MKYAVHGPGLDPGLNKYISYKGHRWDDRWNLNMDQELGTSIVIDVEFPDFDSCGLCMKMALFGGNTWKFRDKGL